MGSHFPEETFWLPKQMLLKYSGAYESPEDLIKMYI